MYSGFMQQFSNINIQNISSIIVSSYRDTGPGIMMRKVEQGQTWNQKALRRESEA